MVVFNLTSFQVEITKLFLYHAHIARYRNSATAWKCTEVPVTKGLLVLETYFDVRL